MESVWQWTRSAVRWQKTDADCKELRGGTHPIFVYGNWSRFRNSLCRINWILWTQQTPALGAQSLDRQSAMHWQPRLPFVLNYCSHSQCVCSTHRFNALMRWLYKEFFRVCIVRGMATNGNSILIAHVLNLICIKTSYTDVSDILKNLFEK